MTTECSTKCHGGGLKILGYTLRCNRDWIRLSDDPYPQCTGTDRKGEYRTCASLAESELMPPLVGMHRWWRASVGALLRHVRCPILAQLSARERELLLSREGTSQSFEVSCVTHVEPCLSIVALSSLVCVSLLLLLRGLLRPRLAFAKQVIGKRKADMSVQLLYFHRGCLTCECEPRERTWSWHQSRCW